MCRTGKSNCRAAKMVVASITSCRTYAVRNQQSEKESDRQNLLTHPAKMVDAVQQTHVHLHTYQAGGHRVRPAGHPDGTPLAQRRAVAGVFWHRSRRQRAQVWVLLRQLRET